MSDKVETTNLSPAEAHRLRNVLVKLARASRSRDDADDTYRLIARMIGTDACQRIGVLQTAEDFLLTVIIPVFNESKTIERVVQRVVNTELPVELIIIDDGSTDDTHEKLEHLSQAPNVIRHASNLGKGAAIRSGLAQATGEVIVIQDADLEYDPRDFLIMLPHILSGEADVVYGSRFRECNHCTSPWWHRFGNRLITSLTNRASKLQLTDVETCYKMIRGSMAEQILPSLCEQRFGIEIELTARLAKLPGVCFREVPISYNKRTIAEGKKIGLRDGFRALWCIAKYT